MKAILVIDMPDCCFKCPFADVDEYYNNEDSWWAASCIVLGEAGSELGRLKRCPLKPMPSKRISAVEWLNGIKTHEPAEYDKGWNDCVEMLEGEEYE